MTPTEAIEKGKGLLIEIRFDNLRPIAELMSFKEGWVFADIGWAAPLNTSHPFHLLEGEIEGEGPWTIGKYEIREIEKDDPEWTEWNEWRKIKGSLDASREQAVNMAEGSLGLK